MGSWRIGRLFGIGLYVHWSFLLLIGWLVWVHTSAGDTAAQTVQGILLVLAVFGCVVLHELGHALAARRFGIPTRDITLLPIGGVARLERMPSDPVQELVVALAGPAVNVLIVLVLLPLVFMELTAISDPMWVLTKENFALQLAVVNVLLIVFNLLPAFPMDGGRVVRALLATMMNYARATEIAAGLGQAMAVLFAIVGLFFWQNPFLALIGLMIFFGARQEVHAARLRTVLRGVPVRSAMMTRFYSLSPDEPLGPVLQALMITPQPVFPVLEDERVVGVLTQADLAAARTENFGGPVQERMRDASAAVVESDSLESVFDRLQSGRALMVPVERDGRLVGIVTPQTVRQWMDYEAAARDPRRRGSIHDAVFVPLPPRKADSHG